MGLRLARFLMVLECYGPAALWFSSVMGMLPYGSRVLWAAPRPRALWFSSVMGMHLPASLLFLECYGHAPARFPFVCACYSAAVVLGIIRLRVG